MTHLKAALKHTTPYRWLRQYRLHADYRKWMQAGQPVPPPHLVKQKTIKKYAAQFGIQIFIETGTYLGDMVDAMKNSFEHIYSIEINPNLFRAAKQRFQHVRRVSIILGDSGEVLKSLLPTLNQTCLFWLDGHYSAGITGKGLLETPIMQELDTILNHSVINHTVLIDDARCFTGQNDYPRLDELQAYMMSRRPNWLFEVQDDIIRFCLA
jgi:hypothetical protein